MKRTLALEWSSRKLSVAIGEVSKEASLDRFRAPEAMGLVDAAMAESGFSEIDEIKVGRGPGNFSGIRLAFAWASGFAAPGGVELISISSCRALVSRMLQEEPRSQGILILGDARRGQWWGGVFRPQQSGEWEMHAPEVWLRRVRSEAESGCPLRVISPDAERLAAAIECEALYPHAQDLLAWTGPSEPAEPLYFHPPV
ncbi:MAG: tRNA (adenosine(37)-N6)-threonylcarbamoyltransferase complex dimerization subunit type 1 TsaB [Verrucomicrobia bacterium]|nr:tRNA (adenosine(37)-N6)-threonylcarbamoyltransferase complex dimerization subunit type 1 TsaB [Verrucomicrobiota bacterium]MCH8512059.1 tRNA (adenosine(37)-N6)-threonylcarbamoyltransferase complex dimerization subunit type 1 TsaB [Kiritimatiellia bacterium]